MKYRIVITKAWPEMAGQWLRAATPARVKRLGYGFTATEAEAWDFPSEKQAAAKVRVLERHFSSPGLFATKPTT